MSQNNANEFSEHPWMSPYTSRNKDLYFTDGKRSIDFVLVYKQTSVTPANTEKRIAFLKGLAREMVAIEVEDCYGKILGKTTSHPPSPMDSPIKAQTQQAVSAAVPVVPDDRQISPHRRSEQDSGAQPSSMDRYRLQAKHEESALLELSDLVFVKLHAPWKTMERYAEMFNFRKPLRLQEDTSEKSFIGESCSSCCNTDTDIFKPLRNSFTWPFQKQREYLFDIPENRDEFFTAVERAMVVDYILRRTPCVYGDEDQDMDGGSVGNLSGGVFNARRPGSLDIGITKLISDGVFIAAYPLHELTSRVENYANYIKNNSPTDDEAEKLLSHNHEPSKILNNRIILGRHWASFKCFAKQQPLDYIRYYFGEAIAFYFAWLGFYTSGLVPVAILGVLIFLLGLVNMFSDPIVKDVCEHGANIIMCPMCNHVRCKFWQLNSSCLRSKLTRLVDNEGTVVFGVIMALWAIVFLELWKRKQISLAYRWSVYSLEPIDQPPRPEFLALLQKGYPSKLNPISGIQEPMVPFWRRRVPCFCFSFTSVLFGVLLTLAALVGVIFYKLVMKTVFYKQPNVFVQRTAGILTTITGSILNLIFIFIMKFIYNRLAVKLNDLENHRTQVEYDNSLTLKLYLLQFVNYYSSIFYIAFIQGTTAALPGERHSIIQSTGCDEGDCLFELFLQLVIIMVGKQLLNFVQEAMMPFILRIVRNISTHCRCCRRATAPETADQLESMHAPGVKPVNDRLLACRSDYNLLDPGSRPLFEEYLEMMIQFGFITMFVPAFPLAPFFGLLNNLFEIRGDAKKFVNQYRRPVVDRVKTIGIWYTILLALSSLAIRTNACVIAFTTQFIDRWVYRMHYSPDHSNVGFKNFTLSYMESSRFPGVANTTYCRYDDYREPPWVDPSMSHTLIFYHVLAVKFIFVFIFESIAILLTSIIAAIIPDVPKRVKKRIYFEANETNRIILDAELNKKRKRPGKMLRWMLKKEALDKIRDTEAEEVPLSFLNLYPTFESPQNTMPPPESHPTNMTTESAPNAEYEPLIGFNVH